MSLFDDRAKNLALIGLVVAARPPADRPPFRRGSVHSHFHLATSNRGLEMGSRCQRLNDVPHQ